MGRLHCVTLLSPDLERQRAFYAGRLGLESAAAPAGALVFALRGAPLVLLPQSAGGSAEMNLALDLGPLDAALAALRARKARIEDGIHVDATGRYARVRDPEGNVVRVLEPAAVPVPGVWPESSHVIVGARAFTETVAFYRETLGLKTVGESDHWAEFATGATHLAVFDRAHADALPLYDDQHLALALEDDDFDAWMDELRGREVTFAAAPAEGELGPQAEVEDGDGWLVVLRGPKPVEPPDEDALDAEYGEDGDGDHGLPRRAGELSGEARRPVWNAAKAARKQAARTAKQPAPEPERGGFVPRAGRSAPRPFTPRPDTPRSDAQRPFTPRPDTPRSDAQRPFTPRPDAPRPPRPPRPAPPGRDRDA